MNKFHSKEPDIPWRTLMPGDYIKTLRHVENKFAIHMLKVEAGFTEAPETHDADQYAYVLRGKAESHSSTNHFSQLCLFSSVIITKGLFLLDTYLPLSYIQFVPNWVLNAPSKV